MPQRVYATSAWLSLRKRVLERDGWRCQIRLPGCKGTANAVDHIVEIAEGGALYDPANLQAACGPCNTGKRNRRVAERARRSGAVRAW